MLACECVYIRAKIGVGKKCDWREKRTKEGARAERNIVK